MKYLILVIVCTVSIAGAADNGFPDDPEGVEIIDRAYYRGFFVQDEVVLYLRLFNDGEQGTIEMFNGTPNGMEYSWELIYSWQPRSYDDSPLTFRPVCVISIQPNSNSLHITWVQMLFTEYIEGLGSLYLEYDFESGDIGELFVD